MFGGFNDRFTCHRKVSSYDEKKKLQPRELGQEERQAMIVQDFCELCRIKDESDPREWRIYQRI